MSVRARSRAALRRAGTLGVRIGRASLAALVVLVTVQALPALASAAATGAVSTQSVVATQPDPGPMAVDYPGKFRASTPSRLKNAGIGIVVRYVGAAKWKCLTRSEANALRRQGIDIATVYETKANWMLAGRKAGVSAAKKARAAVIGCGGPRTPFVYFACDVATHNYTAVNACLRGAASVLGVDHVGIYGSYSVCDNALRAGVASKAWQTEAWSGGRWLPQAVMYQKAGRINGSLGVDYDSDLLRADDVGQWSYAGVTGVSWEIQPSGSNANLSGADFTDPGTGWAVGDGGTVLHTADAGSTWTTQAAGTSADLRAVTFADSSSGWAVGDGGTVLHTADGGATWAAQSSGTGHDLRGVSFASASSGWAVGDGGTVLHTADGGATWDSQTSSVTADLHGVSFAGATLGWAVGSGGTIAHTADGGSTWTTQVAGTDAALRAVHFVNPTNGWAVGSGGTVLHTADGGTTWVAQAAETTADLNAVDFVDATTGWAAGDGGGVTHATRQSPYAFGTAAGIVIDASTGVPVSGASVRVGTRPIMPTATDGSFVVARVAPGTYPVTVTSPRYITMSTKPITVWARSTGSVRARPTPRAKTSVAEPILATATPLAGQACTLTVTVSPSFAATSGATTLYLSHYVSKTVVKKVKGKKKRTTVWFWKPPSQTGLAPVAPGKLSALRAFGPGRWRAYARYTGSGTTLPSVSATLGFVVH